VARVKDAIGHPEAEVDAFLDGLAADPQLASSTSS
jgi:hypothetical protein